MSDQRRRHRNDGLRKVCGCPRRQWAKCPHAWYFSYRWRGIRYRFCLDRQLGRAITNKTEARKEVDRIRTEIRGGTFKLAGGADQKPKSDALIVKAFGVAFIRLCAKRGGKNKGESRARHADAKCSAGVQCQDFGCAHWEGGHNDRSILKRFEQLTGATGLPIAQMTADTITEADIEAVVRALRTEETSASTRNKYVQLFASMSKWGRKKGYLSRPWIDPDSDLSRESEVGAKRNRRITPEEEQQLRKHAHPRLLRLIIAALESCCRQGELLSLQWKDVGADCLRIRAANTKDGEAREIPISTPLKAVLEMARLDPAGRRHGPDAYVFGTEDGQRLTSVQKTWETTVLKAHGHTPTWVKGKGKLTPESQAAYSAIDLHFHDLRHEAGSRLLESGWALHHIRDMYGHADISTTSRYLNVGRMGLLDAMRRSEGQTGTIGKNLAKNQEVEAPLLAQENTENSDNNLIH